jgi:hypothetical protein
MVFSTVVLLPVVTTGPSISILRQPAERRPMAVMRINNFFIVSVLYFLVVFYFMLYPNEILMLVPYLRLMARASLLLSNFALPFRS